MSAEWHLRIAILITISILIFVAPRLWWKFRTRVLRKRGWVSVNALASATAIPRSDLEGIAKLVGRKLRAEWRKGELWLDGESARLLQDAAAKIRGDQSKAGAELLQHAGLSAAFATLLAAAVEPRVEDAADQVAEETGPVTHIKVRAGCQGYASEAVARAPGRVHLHDFSRVYERVLPAWVVRVRGGEAWAEERTRYPVPRKEAAHLLGQLDLWHHGHASGLLETEEEGPLSDAELRRFKSLLSVGHCAWEADYLIRIARRAPCPCETCRDARKRGLPGNTVPGSLRGGPAMGPAS